MPNVESPVTKPESRPQVLKFATMVPGLDSLLQDELALPSTVGLVILIKGSPGSGKTTMALQIALAAQEWDKLTGGIHYCTCEQERDDILRKYSVLRSAVEKDAAADPTINEWRELAGTQDYEEPFSPSSSTLQTLNSIRQWLSEKPLVHGKQARKHSDRIRLLVVDGVNALSDAERDVAEIERLVDTMRHKCKVGILVYEPSREGYSGVDFKCDVVIEMQSLQTEGPEDYFLSKMRISKSRFQPSGLGSHQYKIRDKGIAVFPSIHFLLSQHTPLLKRYNESLHPITEPQSHSGDEKKDPIKDEQSHLAFMLNAGRTVARSNLKRGSCTVILGPRRAWKTQLTFDFLRKGFREPDSEPGLLVSLIDNQGAIIEQRKSLCRQDCPKPCGSGRNRYGRKCYDAVHLLQIPPGCITPAEFFDTLERRLTYAEQHDRPIQRLVFWDLAQLEYRFPLLAADPMFLPGLMDYLRYSKRKDGDGKTNREITSVFMGASNTDIAKAASAMADNVVFCWQDKHATRGEGVAFYVDRIEGHPGDQRMFFIQPRKLAGEQSGLRKRGEEKSAVREQMLKWGESRQLHYAKGMIEAIQSLQGLRGLPQDHTDMHNRDRQPYQTPDGGGSNGSAKPPSHTSRSQT